VTNANAKNNVLDNENLEDDKEDLNFGDWSDR